VPLNGYDKIRLASE